MSGFGWSFYGFFLFAVAWIAVYFAWVCWTSRERPGAGNQNSESAGQGRVQDSGIRDQGNP
jgi:hypothetical protein